MEDLLIKSMGKEVAVNERIQLIKIVELPLHAIVITYRCLYAYLPTCKHL
jgi:hypothetical protein